MNFSNYFDELQNRTLETTEKFTKTYSETSDEENQRREIENFLDFIEDELLGSIELGVTSANEDLMSQFDANYLLDDEVRRNLIFEEVAGSTWVERVLNLVSNGEVTGSKVNRIVETESHRIINNVKYIVGSVEADRTGIPVYKEWATQRDDKVRETHNYLEGSKVKLNEPFVTIGGDSALYPGGFTDAENNVNCRCIVKLSI